MRVSRGFISTFFAIFFIASCSYSSLRPEIVDRSDAQRMETVVFATVVSSDRIILSGDGDNVAVTGSSIIDSERESDIAGVLGPFDGLAGDDKVEDVATRRPAIELLLDIDSGKIVSIVQKEGKYSFAVGQRVKIIKSKGKSRVLPL
ncbi:MAG: hypothetical protein CMD68_02805 [Gammaproteobacteria bacterium]|nr:hypothetical protein [Gammaproteobacteria bacterium]